MSNSCCDPMDCSPPGSSVHGISQSTILEWVTISSRGSSWPRDWTHVSCTDRGILYHQPPGKPTREAKPTKIWVLRIPLGSTQSLCWSFFGLKWVYFRFCSYKKKSLCSTNWFFKVLWLCFPILRKEVDSLFIMLFVKCGHKYMMRKS